jgi:hypothetical protein
VAAGTLLVELMPEPVDGAMVLSCAELRSAGTGPLPELPPAALWAKPVLLNAALARVRTIAVLFMMTASSMAGKTSFAPGILQGHRGIPG